MDQEQRFVVIRIRRATWVKLKIVAAIIGLPISEVADKIVTAGLKEYNDCMKSTLYKKDQRTEQTDTIEEQAR